MNTIEKIIVNGDLFREHNDFKLHEEQVKMVKSLSYTELVEYSKRDLLELIVEMKELVYELESQREEIASDWNKSLDVLESLVSLEIKTSHEREELYKKARKLI